MPLFSFRHVPTTTDAEVREIKERVQEMRRQVGHREVALADIFALLRSEERKAPATAQARPAQLVERVWPDEVPVAMPPDGFAVTYGAWGEIRRAGLPTR